MPKQISTKAGLSHPDVLDHASEFVEVVISKAPEVYRRLLESGRYRKLLEEAATFNHGKLYAWSEFLVFRAEFKSRFPDASDRACINAFSRLLLKNDISITNLAEAVEGRFSEEFRMLKQRGFREIGPGSNT